MIPDLSSYHWIVLNSSAGKDSQAMLDVVLEQCDKSHVPRSRLQQTGLDDNAIADMHGAAFEPEPHHKEDCIDPKRQDFLEQLLQTPDYHSLHASTMLTIVRLSQVA